MGSPRRDHTLIYLHIPKTAGSTLSLILLHQYRAGEIYPFIRPEEYDAVLALPPSEKARYKLFQGHFPFGLHAHLDAPSAYMTTLREPLQVALSSYFYFELAHRHAAQNTPIDWSMPTLDDLRYGTMRILFDNVQTRFLSGQWHIKIGSCSREMLEQAKEHLRAHFVVGLVERFDESVILMAKRFGWRMPYYVPANVTHKRPRRAPPSPDVAAWLREHNALDMELYEFGKTLFAEQVAAIGIDLAAALTDYRRRNRLLGPILDRSARARRRARRIPWIGAYV